LTRDPDEADVGLVDAHAKAVVTTTMPTSPTMNAWWTS